MENMIYTHAHLSLGDFNEMLEYHDNKSPIFFIINSNVNLSLIKKYRKIWGDYYDNTMESFSKKSINMDNKLKYANRIYKYFGVDQIASIDMNKANIVCTWDAKKDCFRMKKPCFIAMKLFVKDSTLHMSVVWRNRDLLRRLIGNWVACRNMLIELSKRYDKDVGNIYDFSMQAYYKSEDYKLWTKK